MTLDLTQSQKEIDELEAKMAEMRAQITEMGKAAFSKACEQLFAKHPLLEAFKWTQYTPYFNDGESCEFGVNDVEDYRFNGPVEGLDSEEDDNYDNDEDWVNIPWKANKYLTSVEDDVRAVRGLLSEDTCLELFGDHCEVKVSRTGVETDEYSHE